MAVQVQQDTFPVLDWERKLGASGLAPRLKDLARLMASRRDEGGYLKAPILWLRLEHVSDGGKQSLSSPRLLDEKTIDRRVKALTAAGWFVRVKRGGEGKPTLYRMAFPALETGEPNGTSGSASNGTSDVPLAVGNGQRPRARA